MLEGKKLMTSYHSKNRRKTDKRKQLMNLYQKLQFKKVVKKFYVVLTKNHQKSAKKNRSSKNTIDKGSRSAFKPGKESKDVDDMFWEPFEFPSTVSQNQSTSSLVLKTDTCFYGCERNTKSCVGQIFNNQPFYTYLEKNTPPCCFSKLKMVFQYLIEELQNTGVRLIIKIFSVT